VPNINLKDHPQIFQDRPQQIWVVNQQTYGVIGASATLEGAHQIPELVRPSELPFTVTEVTLHRPSLQPIYGGPTLLEALWAEMDRLMAGLMTGQDAEDGGDKARAQELAWVLAIVTNAYNPSIDAIRAEAVRRWNEEVDQDDMNTRPQGADQ
jgi:hypothetical protein